jgi:hypothetical protein
MIGDVGLEHHRSDFLRTFKLATKASGKYPPERWLRVTGRVASKSHFE